MERTPTPPPQVPRVSPMNAHLSADDLSGMVDGGLSAARRTIVEAHLAVCADCRAELVSASAIVESAPPKQVRRTKWIARAALAAAAASVILLVPRGVSRRGNAPDVDLTRHGSGPSAITIIDPAPHVNVDRDSIRFVWHGERGDTYRLVVLDSAGGTVFKPSTTDTVVIPPSSLVLVPGARYFWFVEVLRPDGSSPSTAPSSFSVRAR